ncbi:MAG: tRNA pseudouridine(38-40) synthase TruA [Kistimonas sp.]|nr:tRNA pseudouridine(38-40) synthase TruA [Kistimonas sp.]
MGERGAEEEALQAPSQGFFRLAACVEYDGSGFHGWQKLKSGLPTVQAVVEQALGRVAGKDVSVVCAGRTDAGVHACRQIVHFDTTAVRCDRSWVLGSNSQLPETVAVRWVRPVERDFHARFAACARRYRYIIHDGPVRPAILRRGLSWHRHPLDLDAMRSAAPYLVGTHDFTSYRTVHCQARNPVRTVEHLQLYRLGGLLVMDVQANAFLHHMIRNMAGVLIAIGQGRQSPEWAGHVLQARDRRAGGVTAAPHGLYFVDALYPPRFALPREPLGPSFLGEQMP